MSATPRAARSLAPAGATGRRDPARTRSRRRSRRRDTTDSRRRLPGRREGRRYTRPSVPTTPSSSSSFPQTFADVADVQGWMTEDQARRLWDRSHELGAPAQVVEIGSYQGRSAIVLARAAANGVLVVAIDP